MDSLGPQVTVARLCYPVFEPQRQDVLEAQASLARTLVTCCRPRTHTHSRGVQRHTCNVHKYSIGHLLYATTPFLCGGSAFERIPPFLVVILPSNVTPTIMYGLSNGNRTFPTTSLISRLSRINTVPQLLPVVSFLTNPQRPRLQG